MRRREFCKLMAATAAATAVPGSQPVSAQAAEPAPPETMGPAQASADASGFGAYTQDYAQFCATPAERARLLCARGRQDRQRKAERNDWKPTDWGEPPELPIPGGSWDGVPMDSPIPNLGGRRSVQAHLGFAAAVRSAGVVSRREVRHLGALEPAVRARSGRLVRPQHVHRGPPAIQVSAGALRPSLALRLQGPLRAVDAAQLAAG